MADITPDFNICLHNKGAQPVLKRDFDVEKINSFLQEAYDIVCFTSDGTMYGSDNVRRMLA
jgi:syntaxin 18